MRWNTYWLIIWNIYVPTIEAERNVCPNGYKVPVDDTRFDSKLMGGDQLTVCWIRGTRLMRSSQDMCIDHYEGLIPVVEDCHARMIWCRLAITKLTYLLAICYNALTPTCWSQLYKTKLAKEKRIMYQRKNVINRKSVPQHWEKTWRQLKIFLLFLHAQVIYANWDST